MAESNERCIICWLEKHEFTPTEAAAFMLGEAINYPKSTEPRFRDLCTEHAKEAHKMGKISAG